MIEMCWHREVVQWDQCIGNVKSFVCAECVSVDCNSKKSNKKEIAIDEIACKSCGKPVKVGMFCQYCGTRN